MRLFDLNENNEYATYSETEGGAFVFCWVQGKTCQTEGEWRKLIRPFMEE
jgi:hypothetical protein